MRTIRLEEMNWPDIRSALERGYTTAVVGVGSTEQHGPHLPTMTDSRIGDEVTKRVALKLGNALQARTIMVGCSRHHLAFPGTISLQEDTLRRIVIDYTDSLVRNGFKTLVFLPFHGGNFVAVREAVAEAQAMHPGVRVIGVADLPKLMSCLAAASAEFGIDANASGAHAGESEASMMMALEEELVVPERFAPGYLGAATSAELKTVLERGMEALSTRGVIGDPTTASAQKGRLYLDRLTEFLVGEIDQLAR